MGIRTLLFGYNTNFGKDGLGTFASVGPLAARLGFEAVEAPPVSGRGRPLSATRIRDAVERGDPPEAEALPGRPPTLLRTVVRGDARGRTPGLPPANRH